MQKIIISKKLSKFYFLGNQHSYFIGSFVATLRSSVGFHGVFTFSY